MNNEDLAYLAGIIDGEGTVTLGGFKNLSYSLTPSLDVTNINIELMEWLKRNFNGKVRIVKPSKWQKQQNYKWYYYGEKVIDILRDVFPWLIIKRKQAMILFDWELLRLPPNKGTKRKCRNSVSEEEKQRRLILIKEIKILNKRGRERKI